MISPILNEGETSSGNHLAADLKGFQVQVHLVCGHALADDCFKGLPGDGELVGSAQGLHL